MNGRIGPKANLLVFTKDSDMQRYSLRGRRFAPAYEPNKQRPRGYL